MFRKFAVIILLPLVIVCPLSLSKISIGSDESTYDEDFFITIAKKDPVKAQELMKEKLQIFPNLAQTCHEISHKIGRAALRKNGNFGQSISEESEICNSGYLHGVIEEYFNERSDDLESIRKVCKEYTQKRIAWHCNHGVGHGLMLISNNNLDWSLKFCGSYDEAFVQQRCANGVFMEYFVNDYILDTEDNLYPCDRLTNTALEENCYMYVPEGILRKSPGDYQKALQICGQIENADFRKNCIGGTGSVMVKNNATNTQLIKENCLGLTSSDMESCFSGAIWRHLSLFNYLQKTEEFCKQLGSVAENSCKNTVIQYDSLVGL